MESNAFMVKLYLELFKKIGIAINEVRIIGGGSNSNLWNQITADVTKLTVRTVKNSQASLLGAAMIAAVGSGYYQDYSQAARSMVKTGKEYRPEHRLFEVYEYNYDKFLKIYKNNINIF
jgi:xylulokinase